jgi:iron(III) transport system permease protein
MRFNYAALTQVHRELEEASVACGARWGMTFRAVIVPLIMPGLVAAWIYIIALTFKVLSLPVMLSGVNNKMLSVLIFDLVEENHTKELAALGVLLVLLLAMLTLAAQLVGRRFGVQQTE